MEYKKLAKSLHQKKYRQAHQLFLVEGEKSVLELLKADWQTEILFCTEKFYQKNDKNFYAKVKNLQIVKLAELQQISTHQNIDSAVAIAQIPQNNLPKIQSEYILALASVSDPGNLGTIIRIADWYGIKKIICSQDCVDEYNPKTIAASMASFLRVQVFYLDLENWLAQNQKPVYGALLDGKNIYQTQFEAQNGVFLLGNEAKGIPQELRKYINFPIQIPRFGHAESLNVAIATAVICDNWKRQSLV